VEGEEKSAQCDGLGVAGGLEIDRSISMDAPCWMGEKQKQKMYQVPSRSREHAEIQPSWTIPVVIGCETCRAARVR
jgi:hypothetical protein